MERRNAKPKRELVLPGDVIDDVQLLEIPA